MDNGFDYPNDLCVQNALWRRLDAIEILLQIHNHNQGTEGWSLSRKTLSKVPCPTTQVDFFIHTFAEGF